MIICKSVKAPHNNTFLLTVHITMYKSHCNKLFMGYLIEFMGKLYNFVSGLRFSFSFINRVFCKVSTFTSDICTLIVIQTDLVYYHCFVVFFTTITRSGN